MNPELSPCRAWSLLEEKYGLNFMYKRTVEFILLLINLGNESVMNEIIESIQNGSIKKYPKESSFYNDLKNSLSNLKYKRPEISDDDEEIV